jgi:hypothetical protein
MSDQSPLFRHTFKTFGEAIGVHPRTVRRMTDDGEVRTVRFGSKKKPIVRLEEPDAYIARNGRYSGPEPEPGQ